MRRLERIMKKICVRLLLFLAKWHDVVQQQLFLRAQVEHDAMYLSQPPRRWA